MYEWVVRGESIESGEGDTTVYNIYKNVQYMQTLQLCSRFYIFVIALPVTVDIVFYAYYRVRCADVPISIMRFMRGHKTAKLKLKQQNTKHLD